MQPILLGGGDAGLMPPVELDRLIHLGDLFSRQGAARTQRHPRPESASERQGAAAADLASE